MEPRDAPIRPPKKLMPAPVEVDEPEPVLALRPLMSCRSSARTNLLEAYKLFSDNESLERLIVDMSFDLTRDGKGG